MQEKLKIGRRLATGGTTCNICAAFDTAMVAPYTALCLWQVRLFLKKWTGRGVRQSLHLRAC